MRQVLSFWCVAWLSASGLAACSDEGIGQDCLPDRVPCDAEGKNCGFKPNQKFVQTPAGSCPSSICIVHKLDNGTAGAIPADPRVVCTGVGDPAGCVPQAALDEASYCSCRCNPADDKGGDSCTCPGDFVCEPFFGAESFCVKKATIRDE